MKSTRFSIRARTLLLLLALTVIIATLPIMASGDSANYFYDELGRLSRVSKGTSGVLYEYDELGNVVSTTNHSINASAPVVYSINPATLFNGSRMFVNISGINLFTTSSVTSNNPNLTIENFDATATKVTAEMTAYTTGAATVTVTTLYGAANIGISLSGSTLKMSPAQTALSPGANGSLNLSINPPIASAVRINLQNSNPAVVTSPEWVSVPSTGSVDFGINTLQNGVTHISAGGAESIVFVTSPFGGYTGITTPTSKSLSVSIDSPAGNSPAVASPLSVSIDSPTGNSPAMASPLSVSIDSPTGNSPAMASPLSVSIDSSPGNSPAITSPLSVIVDSPSGESSAVADLISVEIEQ